MKIESRIIIIVTIVIISVLLFLYANYSNDSKGVDIKLQLRQHPDWIVNDPGIDFNKPMVDVRSNAIEMLIFNNLYKEYLYDFTGNTQHTITNVGGATDRENFDVLNSIFWGFRDGVSLELGGLDGSAEKGSMTYDLERYFGWKRILIEGNPSYRESLKEKSPKAFSVNAAICEEEGIVHYGKRDYVGGILEFMAPSFTKVFYPEIHASENKKFTSDNGHVDWSAVLKSGILGDKIVEVDCLRMSRVLDAVGVAKINFFILDVEGGELSVLKAIDWDRISFDVLCIETDPTLRPVNYREEIVSLLASKGYEDYSGQQGRNTWFKRKDFLPSPSPYSTRGQFNEAGKIKK